MTTLDRKVGRNVHFHDASNPEILLGGLVQNGSITERNFIDMLEILLIVRVEYSVIRRQNGQVITRSNQALQIGDYDIYCDSTIRITDEAWVARVITFAISGREDKFKEGVRARDGKCVFSGTVNHRANANNWNGFQAAHLFPLGSESLWQEKNFGNWITDTKPGESKINSIQNGFLVQLNFHAEWDNYLMSVNSDDNYKIVVFSFDQWGLDGKILDPVCRDPQDPHRVSDQLLRWHYRQCVLANMRAAGEPIFDYDHPPGSDIMGELREAPFGQEQFELMLEDRLRGLTTV